MSSTLELMKSPSVIRRLESRTTGRSFVILIPVQFFTLIREKMATHSKIFYFVCESQKKKLKLLQWIWGKAFISWVKENLPPAQIVFNHFHVIKLMNEKLDLVRRRITVKLDTAERAILKNQRFTLLRNEENLSSEASAYLAKIKQTFQELADVHMMKEALRSIYSVAQNVSQAEDALLLWVKAT